jgi:hypothetical protein
VGITTQAATFTEDTPALEEVVFAASRLSGLQLTCRRSTEDKLYRFHAEVAFACYPREREEIFAYDLEELRAFYGQLADLTRGSEVAERAAADRRFAAGFEAFATSIATRNKPTIYLRGFVGEEGTLRVVLALALESLGGSLLFPMSDAARALCSVPLTAVVIRQRHRRHRREWVRELAKLPTHVVAAVWRWLLRKMGIVTTRTTTGS